METAYSRVARWKCEPVKFNWRLILIHLLGTIFISFSLRELSSLSDVDFIKQFDPIKAIEKFKTGTIDFNIASRLFRLNYLDKVAKYIGIIVSFIISLIISFRQNWSWINSVVTFLLALILALFGILSSEIIKVILLFPRIIFRSLPIQYMYLFSGITLLTLGTFIFLSKKINAWIKWENNILL